ncbi:MAG: crossover junction endodeoxyribonuclease RuvC [Candidatus Dormibacteraceae bacterium]
MSWGNLLLGIDPGLANTGWAVIDEGCQIISSGTIRTTPGPTAPRLHAIISDLSAVLNQQPIVEAAIEELFAGRNTTSVILVAQAKGAILAALAAAQIPVYEYKPAQIKVVLTGYGNADKRQMAKVIALQTKASTKMDDHAVDAVAIAICHARSRRIRLLAR